ncbi:MAG: HAD hydrolase-like protein [Patescibacteria group bacterium]
MNVIFDFDGVLANTWSATLKSYMAINNIDDKVQAELELINTRYTNSSINNSTLNKSNNFLTLEYKKREFNLKDQLPTLYFNQFIENLKKLQKDNQLAIVSTSSQEDLEIFAEKYDIEFTHKIGFSQGFNKLTKIKEIISDWDSNPQDVYYVTDTINDILDMKSLLPYENILGAAWGYQGYSYLRSILPNESILLHPNEIHSKLGLAKSIDLSVNIESLTLLEDDLIKSSKSGIVTLLIKTKKGTLTIPKSSKNFFNFYPSKEVILGFSILDTLDSLLEELGVESGYVITNLKRCYDWSRDSKVFREFLFEINTEIDNKGTNQFQMLSREESKKLIKHLLD